MHDEIGFRYTSVDLDLATALDTVMDQLFSFPIVKLIIQLTVQESRLVDNGMVWLLSCVSASSRRERARTRVCQLYTVLEFVFSIRLVHARLSYLQPHDSGSC